MFSKYPNSIEDIFKDIRQVVNRLPGGRVTLKHLLGFRAGHTTYWTDSAGSNTAPYDTQAKAATAIQTVLDLATAGDVINAVGTQTIAARIDFDTNQGDKTNGYITINGLNSSGVEDGTYFTIDANSAVDFPIYATNKDMYRLKNIEIKNATSFAFGFASGGNDDWIMENCSVNNCGNGAALSGFARFFIKDCVFENNTNGGIASLSVVFIVNCKFIGNADGIEPAAVGTEVYGSIFHNNTTDGINIGASSTVINCVIDGNANGLLLSSGQSSVYGNRITNNTVGITAAAAALTFEDYNFYLNNGTKFSINAAAKLIEGGHSLDSGTEGYNNLGGDDFNLTTSATLRRTAIKVGEYNS